MDPTQFGPLDDHVAALMQRIAGEQARLQSWQETLAAEFLKFQKRNALGGAGVNTDALKAFLDKPYVVRPLGNEQYELIVPTFIGLRGGWALRTDGAFSIYLVNRFIHLINPLPAWLAQELDFRAAPFDASIEGNALVVARGDPKTLAAKLGKGVAKVEGNQIHLKPASRFDIIRRLIREDGILPYAPAPIPQEDRREPARFIARDEHDQPLFTLRPHQQRDYERFLELGSVALFAWGQTGKSYVALQALAGLNGRKIIFVPTRALAAQWKMRLEMLTPLAQADVTVTTYHSLDKYRDTEWTLAIFDEAHHLPADLFIRAAMLKTTARMGLSATPVREDGNEDLIPALCGFPMGADWPVGETQRPRVFVWVVKDENAKLTKCEQLVSEPIKGKTLVFTYRLEIGERVAKRIGAPFAHGGTRQPLDVIGGNDTVVVSKIGDAGLSFPVDRIVEIDFQFGSRQEAGQRALRAAYDTGRKAEYHVLMTREELERYSKRLLIYEQWGLEMQIIGLGDDKPLRIAAARAPRPARSTARARQVRPSSASAAVEETAPSDEIAQVLALRPIAVKVSEVKKTIGARTAPYCEMVFRYCYKAALSPREIADARGVMDAATRSRIASACKALLKAKLFMDAGEGRYRVNMDEVNRARVLVEATR